MANKPKYSVNNVMLCDDIRVERSGKEIIIGVYNDAILLRQFPATVSKIMVRITIDINSKELQNYSFTIKNKAGKNIHRSNQEINNPVPGTPSVFHITIAPALFPHEDTWSLYFGVDKKPVKIGQIEMRLARGEEVQRF